MSKLRPPSAPVAGLVLAVAGLSLALGGCAGFTPLYGAQSVSPKLAAIQVMPPDGRLGFYMHQYLDDSLGRDRAQTPIYRLTMSNREVRVPRGITISNVASRYEVDLTTNYRLVEIATNKEVTHGQVSVNVTYDVQNQPYASLSAQQDGERRVAEQAADRMRLELASYFASPRPTSATVSAPDLSTFSERLPGAVVQTPRQQATGEQQQPSGQSTTFGGTRSITVTPDTTQPFTPSEDPNAIKTLPTDGSSEQ